MLTMISKKNSFCKCFLEHLSTTHWFPSYFVACFVPYVHHHMCLDQQFCVQVRENAELVSNRWSSHLFRNVLLRMAYKAQQSCRITFTWVRRMYIWFDLFNSLGNARLSPTVCAMPGDLSQHLNSLIEEEASSNQNLTLYHKIAGSSSFIDASKAVWYVRDRILPSLSIIGRYVIDQSYTSLSKSRQ